MFTENHKIIIKQIIMEDFDLRPSIAQVVLNCIIESCIRIESEDMTKKKVTDTAVYSNTVANDSKLERLQDISEDDCLKEGVVKYDYGYFIPNLLRPNHNDGIERSFLTPREAFAALIDKVSGKGTWERNPWVMAYSFELV